MRVRTMCAAALFPHSRGTAATCSIDSSARAACTARAFVASRASAAGAMWRCRTASAPWAARSEHTTVIDAAGAIYVIGGYGEGYRNDVWVSTDGGARPDSHRVGRRYWVPRMRVGSAISIGSHLRARACVGRVCVRVCVCVCVCVANACVRRAATRALSSHYGDLRY
jgi:hypothetical protein